MKPFLKWAGGKRWLFTEELTEALPAFNRYIEPFLGGGAGFFAIKPTDSILADVNPELINLYRQIRDEPAAIANGLRDYQELHSKSFYYDMRAKTFTPDILGAVRTLYLNRTCWNGLFRLNLKGKFNVPIGTKSNIFDSREDFQAYACYLKNADLRVSDFEEVITDARHGDLLFVDPPYTVKHNMNGFVKYNESIFSWCDQIRLRDAVQRAVDRGVHILLTNADHESVRELYRDIGSLNSIARKSVISGINKGRSSITEVLSHLNCNFRR